MDRRAFKSFKATGVHRPTLVGMVKKHGWKIGAEIGVDKGILFDRLLTECPELRLIGVDSWEKFPHRYEKCLGIADRHFDRAKIIRAKSLDAAASCPDGEFDFVFIDASHEYPDVKSDISAWRHKVKPGGWLLGHDYHPKNFRGVVRAVDEAFGNKKLLYDGWIWGVTV